MAQSGVRFNDLAGIAAARAALDRDRAGWRSDILLSSVVEVLASRGPFRERELLTQVKALWVTSAVNMAMLRTALRQAMEAGLVEQVRGGTGPVRWTASHTAVVEAKSDRDWAASKIDEFSREMADRLDDLLDEPLDRSRVPRLVQSLLSALIKGSAGVFETVAQTGDTEHARRVGFDPGVVERDLAQRIHPTPVARALAAVALAALDPVDSFGTELLRLIVTAQVLQGLLARRDLGDGAGARDTLFVLDTSALFYRLDVNGPQLEILEDFLEAAVEQGCDVVVSQAVLDEWDRVWDAAEGDGAATTPEERAGARFASNGVLRAWQLSVPLNEPVPAWSQFSRNYRNIAAWLTRRGVRVAPYEESDPTVVEAVRAELQRLSDAAARQLRTDAGALTDGYSAALVAQARLTRPHHKAWFVARESVTNQAYANVVSRDFPLVLPVEAALLFLCRARTEDPSSRRELAEVVGDSLILASFFGVSASYGAEELRDMIAALEESGELSVDDAESALRADYLALAAEAPDPVGEIIRRRALRRNREAKRRQAEADAQHTRMASELAAAELRGRNEGEAARGSLREANAKLKRQMRRLLVLLALLAILAGGTAVIWVTQASDTYRVVAIVFDVIILGEGTKWVMDELNTVVWVASLIAAGAWCVAGVVVGVMITSPDHPNITHPSPSASSSPSSAAAGSASH